MATEVPRLLRREEEGSPIITGELQKLQGIASSPIFPPLDFKATLLKVHGAEQILPGAYSRTANVPCKKRKRNVRFGKRTNEECAEHFIAVSGRQGRFSRLYCTASPSPPPPLPPLSISCSSGASSSSCPSSSSSSDTGALALKYSRSRIGSC